MNLRKYSCKEIELLNEFLPCMPDHLEDVLLQLSLKRALFSFQLGRKGGSQAGNVIYICRLNSFLLLGRV